MAPYFERPYREGRGQVGHTVTFYLSCFSVKKHVGSKKNMMKNENIKTSPQKQDFTFFFLFIKSLASLMSVWEVL